jgi:glucose dehydrogenase
LALAFRGDIQPLSNRKGECTDPHAGRVARAVSSVVPVRDVVRVDVGPDVRVTGLLIRKPDRSETWLGARHLIIAANAIEGPKLLLMSRSERFPNGVANSSGAVGRYLMGRAEDRRR